MNSSGLGNELNQVLDELHDVKNILRSKFVQLGQPMSSKGLANDSLTLINPVDLLDRLENLEMTLEKMQVDAFDIARRRPIIAKELTSAILDNLTSIEELAVLTKGRKAKTDVKTRGYALKVYEQKKYWSEKQEEAESDAVNPLTPRTSQSILNQFYQDNNENKTNADVDDNIVFNDKVGKDLWSSNGSIKIQNEDLLSIPISIRGNARLEHIQNVASILYQEVRSRYKQGCRGRELNVERKSILKHCGMYPGLQSVIRNTSLWRNIVNSLKVLGLVKVDKDGDLSLF